MIVGVNKVYQHDGREYHIQCEDLGIEQASFEVRVYDKGTVLWHKRVPYADIVAQAPAQDRVRRSPAHASWRRRSTRCRPRSPRAS